MESAIWTEDASAASTATQPQHDPQLYPRLRQSVQSEGPHAAIEQLIAELRKAEDFHNLFYALLLRKRWELGVSPFPTGPSTELPPETHEEYEQAIRSAGREVGQALLQRRKLPHAWLFFRLLGEVEPMRAALAAYEPLPDEDIGPLVDVAWHQGVLPQKGFDWVLERHGICSAITLVSSTDWSNNPQLRDYCITRLVRELYQQLVDRLNEDLRSRGRTVPPGADIPTLMKTHPDLVEENCYHVDVSHLSSVVQMSIHLPPGEANTLAQQLCHYGKHLSPMLQGRHEPPFEEGYVDYLAYLEAVAGQNLDTNLERFRLKAERECANGSSYAAQVYVNLLVRLGQDKDALAAARRFLISEDERYLSCPSIYELAQRCGDYETLAEVAAQRQDPVAFLAALLCARRQQT